MNKMQTIPRIGFGKFILINPIEFSWVKRLLNLAKKDKEIKDKCIKWKSGMCPPILIDGQTTGASCWTLHVVQLVLKHGHKIKRHKYGICYK